MDSEISPKSVELLYKIKIKPSLLRFFILVQIYIVTFWSFEYCFGFDLHHGVDIINYIKIYSLKVEYRSL